MFRMPVHLGADKKLKFVVILTFILFELSIKSGFQKVGQVAPIGAIRSKGANGGHEL